jgi:hypothetical protein
MNCFHPLLSERSERFGGGTRAQGSRASRAQDAPPSVAESKSGQGDEVFESSLLPEAAAASRGVPAPQTACGRRRRRGHVERVRPRARHSPRGPAAGRENPQAAAPSLRGVGRTRSTEEVAEDAGNARRGPDSPRQLPSATGATGAYPEARRKDAAPGNSGSGGQDRPRTRVSPTRGSRACCVGTTITTVYPPTRRISNDSVGMWAMLGCGSFGDAVNVPAGGPSLASSASRNASRFPSRRFVTLGPSNALWPVDPEVGARCGKSARRVLCGGRPDEGRPYRDHPLLLSMPAPILLPRPVVTDRRSRLNDLAYLAT